MKKILLTMAIIATPFLFMACEREEWWYEPGYSDDGYGYNGGGDNNNDENTGSNITTSPLVGQWEGSITNYYTAMYPNLEQDTTCATILEFTTDGDGAQLDYDESSPKEEYSYMPFSWYSNGSAIVIVYEKDEDGNTFPTATITDFALTETKFTGQVSYGTESYAFKYGKTSGFDWSAYQQSRAVGSESVAHDIMEELKANKSKATAKGSFAK